MKVPKEETNIYWVPIMYQLKHWYIKAGTVMIQTASEEFFSDDRLTTN